MGRLGDLTELNSGSQGFLCSVESKQTMFVHAANKDTKLVKKIYIYFLRQAFTIPIIIFFINIFMCGMPNLPTVKHQTFPKVPPKVVHSRLLRERRSMLKAFASWLSKHISALYEGSYMRPAGLRGSFCLYVEEIKLTLLLFFHY